MYNTKYKTMQSGFLATIIVLGVASVVLAGDVEVRGDGTGTYVFDVQDTSTVPSNRVAVFGRSEAFGYWGLGIGGKFIGGNAGVIGESTALGSGNRTGGSFTAGLGEWNNIGVSGQSLGGVVSCGVYGRGLGGYYSYAGYFDGNVVVNGQVEGPPSDESLKTDINDLDGALEQLMDLTPKHFRYRIEENPDVNLPDGFHMGLVAQDVEEVFPDLVSNVPIITPPNDKDKANKQNSAPNSKEYLSVNYLELIPVLIKAVQEQQEQIEELQYQIATLTKRN